MFDQTFKSISSLFSSMDKEMDEAFKQLSQDAQTTIINNHGHIVITGRVRSVRVNDQVVELSESGHADRRDI